MIAGFIAGSILLGLVTVPESNGAVFDLPSAYENCLGDRPAIFRRANEFYE